MATYNPELHWAERLAVTAEVKYAMDRFEARLRDVDDDRLTQLWLHVLATLDAFMESATAEAMS